MKMETTYIKKVWTENTGGGTMVDFVELSNGIILTITDESVEAHKGEPWEDENPIASMLIPSTDLNTNN